MFRIFQVRIGNHWKGVFIYDESTPEKPRLILAREGTVQTRTDKNELELELRNGSWHEVNPRKPQDYTSVLFFPKYFPNSNSRTISHGDFPKVIAIKPSVN